MDVLAAPGRVLFQSGQSTITLQLTGAASIPPAGEQPAGTVNRLTAGAWKQDLPTYHSLQYSRILPGVDLRLTIVQSTFKSEYIVAPHADPNSIRLRYDGGAVSIEKGSLLVHAGALSLEEPPPVAFQDTPAGRIAVAARYKLLDDGSIGFVLGAYDPAQPLVIDPYVIASASTLGGSRMDQVVSAVSDPSGHLYLAGWSEWTDSTNYRMATPF